MLRQGFVSELALPEHQRQPNERLELEGAGPCLS